MNRCSTPGQDRLQCPRCRANNFAGQPQCWQCRASLPPPESAAAAPRPVAAQARGAWASQRQAPRPVETPNGTAVPAGYTPIGRGTLVLCIVVAGAAACLVFWLVAARLRGDQPALDRPVTARPLEAPPLSETPAAAGTTQDPDPLVAESNRVIERESRHAGLPEPPVSDDGQVHLRSGGSISVDRYRDAQRHVEASPVMHQPLPPPPVP